MVSLPYDQVDLYIIGSLQNGNQSYLAYSKVTLAFSPFSNEAFCRPHSSLQPFEGKNLIEVMEDAAEHGLELLMGNGTIFVRQGEEARITQRGIILLGTYINQLKKTTSPDLQPFQQ